MKLSLLLVSILLACVLPVLSIKVTVQGRQLFVDGKRFIVQSVGYAPTPVGVDPTLDPPYGDYFTSNYANIYRRDLVKIRDLGANAVRIWGWNNGADHSDFLAAAANTSTNRPIYVIPGFFIGPGLYPNLADPATQQKVLTDLTTFVTSIKQNPAVLFYLIGSDLNADWNYGFEKDALFKFLNTLAAEVKKLEPDNPHPVSTALNDQDSIGTILQYDTTVANFDFWALNVYRGCDFGPLFRQYTSISQKPLFISEFGIDEYDDVNLRENATAQATCVTDLWGDIEENETVAIGGSVTEYVDEWWKSKNGQADSRHPGCPSFNPTVHTNCGNPNLNFPDRYANQAYFGLVDAQTFKERLVYYQLQELWHEVNATRARR